MNGYEYMPYIPIITSERRSEYNDFMKSYNDAHKCCPKCHSTSHSTTYVGYILHMDAKDDYKDLNKCVCSNCGSVHTTHERVPE